MNDLETLLLWIRVCMVVAAITTTAFPVLYLFSPWYATKTGQLLMLQAIAFAMAMDLTLLFQFWVPKDYLTIFVLNATVLTFIAGTTSALTWKLWKSNYKRITDEKRKQMTETHPLLSNQTYDRLKRLVTLFLPAFGALYFTLAAIWNLPSAEQVVGTTAAVTTFFGVILGLSTKAYNNSEDRYDGHILVESNEDGLPVASLHLKNYENPIDVVQQEQVVFKVGP